MGSGIFSDYSNIDAINTRNIITKNQPRTIEIGPLVKGFTINTFHVLRNVSDSFMVFRVLSSFCLSRKKNLSIAFSGRIFFDILISPLFTHIKSINQKQYKNYTCNLAKHIRHKRTKYRCYYRN